MALHLDHTSGDFDATFNALLANKREAGVDVTTTVAAILADVRERGDAALCELTERFDRVALEPAQLLVTHEEIADAAATIDSGTREALAVAHARIHSHHARQRPVDDRYTDELGVELGTRWTPVQSAGLYVPGGTASYPSSVLMNAVPAKIAGVERLVMTVPGPDGVLNPLVLAAAELAGVDEIYRVGGAQAIAALAYGTATISPVAMIVGPGNAYVAAAKRQVFGTVGIDMVAGPSEVLILADGSGDPEWIAADLLAQAEHDTAAQAILITSDRTFGDRVAAAVERQLAGLERREIAAASWAEHGAIILVGDLERDAPALADRIAAEHLEIATDGETAERLASQIRNAGAIFLGHHTPEVIGDYVGGSNHVLPTARSARFSSGLGVLNFMKRTSLLKLNADNLRALAPHATALARAEGLGAHEASVAVRLKRASD